MGTLSVGGSGARIGCIGALAAAVRDIFPCQSQLRLGSEETLSDVGDYGAEELAEFDGLIVGCLTWKREPSTTFQA